jgi:hypothetical protein
MQGQIILMLDLEKWFTIYNMKTNSFPGLEEVIAVVMKSILLDITPRSSLSNNVPQERISILQNNKLCGLSPQHPKFVVFYS